MIERFNFFDIFGYLLPGILLIALCWLPFGLFLGEWPPADLASALLLLSLAYLLGHVLHALSEAAFHSKFPDMSGVPRYPSELLLASDDAPGMPGENRFDQKLRERIYKLIEQKFDMTARPTKELEDLTMILSAANVREKAVNSPQFAYADNLQKIREDARGERLRVQKDWRDKANDLARRRFDAFLQCRSFLINRKFAAYTEQQQAMYVVLRGSTAAFLIAAALYLGCLPALLWNVSGWLRDLCIAAPFVVLATGVITLLWVRWSPRKEKRLRERAFWLLWFAALVSSLAIGIEIRPTEHIVGSTAKPPSNPVLYSLQKLEATLNSETNIIQLEKKLRGIERLQSKIALRSHAPTIMAIIGVLWLFLALVCYNAFRGFTIGFAATVYRDFVNVVLQTPPPAAGQDSASGAHSAT